MGIREDLKSSTGPDGFVTGKDGPTNNGLLYSSEAMVTLGQNGAILPDDKASYLVQVDACMVEPGLLQRHPLSQIPHDSDQEGPDDYVWVMAAARRFAPTLAEQVYQYGQARLPLRGFFALWKGSGYSWLDTCLGWLKVRFVYDNPTPGVVTPSSWLGRQPALVCHFGFCTGRVPSSFYRAGWIAAIVSSALSNPKTDGTDPKLLACALIDALPRKGKPYPYLRKAAAFWWKRLRAQAREQAPGVRAMTWILTTYFGAGHFLPRWFRQGKVGK